MNTVLIDDIENVTEMLDEIEDELVNNAREWCTSGSPQDKQGVSSAPFEGLPPHLRQALINRLNGRPNNMEDGTGNKFKLNWHPTSHYFVVEKITATTPATP